LRAHFRNRIETSVELRCPGPYVVTQWAWWLSWTDG